MRILSKKLWITMILGIVCIFTVSGQNAANLDAAIQLVGTNINSRLMVAPKVALMSINSPGTGLSDYVLAELLGVLERKGYATFIDRTAIDRELSAVNLNVYGSVSDSTARQVGKNVGATLAITGSVARTGDNKFRLRVRLITVATSSGALTDSNWDIGIIDNTHILRLLGEEIPVVTPVPAPAPTVVTYKVGDTGPAGGIIFYDKGNKNGGWQYLEAAPSDINRRLRPVTEKIKVPDSRERAMGKGKPNTDIIMREAANKGGGFGWAAQACVALNINGYTDWFLPSRDELNYLYGNLYIQGVGDFRSQKYWSSTAKSRNGRKWWSENFSNGKIDDKSSRREYNVRPIRQF